MKDIEKVETNSEGWIFTESGEFVHFNTIQGLHVTNPGEIQELKLSHNHWSIVNLVKSGSHNSNTGESRFVFRKNAEGQWKLAPVVGNTDWGYVPDRGTYQVCHQGDLILGCDFGHGSPRDWSLPLSYEFRDRLVPNELLEIEQVYACLESLTEDQRQDLMVHQGRRGIWIKE